MVSVGMLESVRNSLPFALLQVDNPFWEDKPMTARNGNNAGDGVTIGELRERLVDCIKLWTASRDLFTTISDQPMESTMEKRTGSGAFAVALKCFWYGSFFTV